MKRLEPFRSLREYEDYTVREQQRQVEALEQFYRRERPVKVPAPSLGKLALLFFAVSILLGGLLMWLANHGAAW